MLLRLFTIACCLSLFAIACNPVEEIIKEQEKNGTFTAKIDGEIFSLSGVFVSADYINTNGIVQSLAIAAAKPPITGTSEGIALVIVSTDSTDIAVGEVYSATNPAKLGAGEYVLDDDNTIDVKAVSENTGIANITITKLDLTNNLVSGTFSFDAVDEDDPTKVYKITEGVFTDIPLQ
ncbi:MAG: DUF6252 family protein [Bacteroidia bacterium]